MALALYRKYRPRTFAEVIGQEHVTEPLSQALRTGRLNHAYLFSGPRGCGKTSSARILARSLNCANGPTPEPCGECDSCRSLSGDGPGSIDVIEIDAASHGGVDDARELRERAVFAPVSSRYKIYVIDEAHMVSSAGFNALLKLVEEPPEYVKFIFATTEPEKVLGTIKSRTHHYPFRLIPPSALRPHLEQLCAAEGVTVAPEVFPLVVRAGGGSARDSLSVLDQLIAGAGDEGVTYARAVALLGVTDGALIDEMVEAVAAGDGAAAYGVVHRLVEAGHDPRRFASDLLERLRDLIVLQQVPDAAAKGIIDGPTDQLARMAAQATSTGAATLSRCADIVHNGLVEMRGTTGPRLLLELICARMLLPGADDASAALLQRLERLESAPPAGAGGRTPSVATPAPVTPAPASTAPSTPLPSSAAPSSAESADEGPAPSAPPAAEPGGPIHLSPSGGPVDLGQIQQRWPTVAATLRRRSPVLMAYCQQATVRGFVDGTLVLLFRHGPQAAKVRDAADHVTEALYEEFGERFTLRCEIAGEQPPPAIPTAPAPATLPPAAAGAPRAVAAGSAPPVSAPRPAPEPPNIPTREADSEARRANGPAPTTSMAAGRPSAAVRSAAASALADGDDWPAPARPGSGTPTPPASPGAAVALAEPSDRPSANAEVQNRAPAARTSTEAPARSAPPPGPSTPPSKPTEALSGLSAARAAARAAAGRAPTTGRPAPARQPTGAWDDGTPLDEPPYDPEFDGPAERPAVEGFDPGDGPLDDIVDGPPERQSGDQAALRLLKERLGAEEITG
ncbi:DNA polymerase III subunit gamma and tau [Pilimelia columellifera]|uniref:DNA polymerase III subunit gamma/tau n=1 Tax=Pilimelia columellifera subsp. columellifera TaxID=706583 RepID=A0ABN3NBT8_9ACTN